MSISAGMRKEGLRSTVERRRLLQFLVAMGLSPAIMVGRAATNTFKEYPFALGVASGSPRADGVVLWTRLVGAELDEVGDVPVRWEVFDDRDPRRLVASGTEVAMAEFGHSVHVELSGLASNHWFRYRFMAGNAVSPTGRTRTAAAPGQAVANLKIAYASCQRWEDGFFAAYRHMFEERPDFVVFLGDYIYEYRCRTDSPVRSHSLGHVRTLADYRNRYELYRRDEDLQRMHAACPWLVTWDDHEVENNYGGWMESAPNMAAYREHRIAGYRAYYEHMPLRATTLLSGVSGLVSTGAIRLYDRFDFGLDVRIHLLDTRQYRDPPLCRESAKDTSIGCQRHDDDARTLLGQRQASWLDASMRQARERSMRWNIVAQQTQFTPRNYVHGKGRKFGPDLWDGYPGAREDLIRSIMASGHRNTMLLGGDIHQNWVAQVHRNPYDAASPVVASEFCGTSVASRSGAKADRVAALVSASPHCLFGDPRQRGYGLVQLSEKQAVVKLRTLDDATSPQSGIGTAAEFAVVSGAPTAQRTA